MGLITWIKCNVFRLSHFDYVKPEDLEKIGMGKPAVRRLLDAVKKKKGVKKTTILDKVKK